MNHSRKYIGSGIIVSNLLMIFAGSFFFRWLWGVKELHQDIALVMLLLIVLVTFCTGVASYFWSFTGVPIRKLRLLAIGNLLWVWVLLLFHPALGLSTLIVPLELTDTFSGEASLRSDLLYNYFSKAFLVIVIICSLLGNWFGRRVLFE